jgi:hypothetical protein
VIASLNRTLDQELAALVRGASLECLVCGEFVLHVRGALACPECRTILAEGSAGWEIGVGGEVGDLPEIELPSVMQAG